MNVDIVKSNITKKDYQSRKLSFGKANKLQFFTSNCKKLFNCLWQLFIKISIFSHFDPEIPTQIENDKSKYAMSKILSQK